MSGSRDEASVTVEQQFATTFEALKIFFEWRYKVLTGFVVMVGAVFASLQWLYASGRPLRATVLFAAAGLSVVMLLCDRINNHQVNDLYNLGKAIEGRLPGAVVPGVFSTIEGKDQDVVAVYGRRRRLRYGNVLLATYGVTSMAFLVAGLIVAV